MNKNLTEMVFILDRSGSMEDLTEETIGGFNSLIKKQKKESEKAVVTTVLFDDNYEILHDHLPIKKVKKMTTEDYYARGTTALFDAVGITIERIGKRLAGTKEKNRPGQVIVIITTDGYENASREYSKSQIKKMIETKTRIHKWQFLFLGANIDAVKEADSLGIRPCMAGRYTASQTGLKSTFRVMDKIIDIMKLEDCEDDEFEELCESAMSELK